MNARGAVVVLVALLAAACTNGVQGQSVTVGSALADYPTGWTVLPTDQLPKGWDWAAQPSPGESATAQLALDGDLSHESSADLAAADLLTAAQVGALPDFAVTDRSEAEFPGAQDGVRITFTYRVDGTGYDGVWLVARSADSRIVAAQLTGLAPLDPDLAESVRAGFGVTEGD